METKMNNGEAMKIDNSKLEAAIEEVIADNKSLEKLSNMLKELKATSLIVPMTFPKDTPKEIIEKVMRRQPIPADKRPPLLQLFVNDAEGNRLIPVLTSLDQVKDPKSFLGQQFFIMMKFPAEKVIEMVTGEKSGIFGMLVNPQSQKFIIKTKAFTMVTDDGKLKRQEIKMTPAQFAVFSRKHTEQALLPRTVFEERADFMRRVDAERENYIAAIFAKPYGEKLECPYKAEDFHVMVLNVDEDTAVACIEMPEKNLVPGFALNIYVVWKEKEDKIYYYTIEQGQPGQNNVVCSVSPQGKHSELLTAPPVGSEISAILELIADEEEEAAENGTEAPQGGFSITSELQARVIPKEPQAEAEGTKQESEEIADESEESVEETAEEAKEEEKPSRRRFFKRVK